MARVFGELELSYLQEVLDSGRLGWYHEENSMTSRLERAFARKVGVRYGIARSSAMTALAQAMGVSGAGVGSEVICDPIVHFGALAAIYMNAVPRFADVRRDTYLMDPASVRANISERTRALIVTHLWGLCAELDELRAICDEHGIFMIEDCAHNVGSTWKGKHAGSYGDLGCFSFQQGKHLPTGDGGMMTTDRPDLYERLYDEWAFSGESPAFMTLNYRMNELTAALGLAQLSRVDGYVAEYTQGLHVLDEAIRDCAWLGNRYVPEEAVQSGYIWTCTWEGDRHGIEYARFLQVVQDLGLPLRYGFTGAPAYKFDFFKVSTAYHHADCPIRCPFYEGDYRYREGLCPTAEDLIPRLIQSGLIEVPPDEVKRRADLLRQAIEITERG
jgi:dTDP-4-amino-4,6-dideoxygalactose transaminase